MPAGIWREKGQTYVDESDVLKGLAAVRAKAGDLRPVFRVMKPILAMDVRSHFQAEDGGEGGHWAPRAPSSVERIAHLTGSRHRRGKKKGQFTKRGLRRLGNQLGRLLGAWMFSMSTGALRMASRVPWAKAQQLGETVGRGSRLPSRGFMWASDDVRKFFTEAVRKHLVRAF